MQDNHSFWSHILDVIQLHAAYVIAALSVLWAVIIQMKRKMVDSMVEDRINTCRQELREEVMERLEATKDTLEEKIHHNREINTSEHNEIIRTMISLFGEKHDS